MSFIYPMFAFILIVISLVLIPRERYRVFFPIIIVSVLIHAALLYFTINIIEAWQFVGAKPFTILGVPIFISISWGPSFALFLWGLPERLPRWTHYVYIASFAVIGVVLDMLFESLGLRPESEWYSPWMWFFPLYLLYWLTYTIYQKRLELDDI